MELGIGGLGYATEIGAGASAIVYRARQLDLDREVAVKVLSVTDEAFVRRFAREAKTLGKLSQNPGIVTVYDTGVTGAGHPYLILELCNSSVLDRLQGPDGPFEPIDACRAAAQVADAVSDAHANGVIHRDIKPGNVLLSQTGRYMVTDFGISTVTGSTMGQTNSVGFTAGYVAPETLSGETAGTPSDIYAVGATLFHMIAGKAPFVDTEQHSNLLALAQRVINDPVPDLRPQGVPDGVCRIIEGAMAKRPQDRPNAAQLRDQLEALVEDLTNPAGDQAASGGPSAGPPPAVATKADEDATKAMQSSVLADVAAPAVTGLMAKTSAAVAQAPTPGRQPQSPPPPSPLQTEAQRQPAPPQDPTPSGHDHDQTRVSEGITDRGQTGPPPPSAQPSQTSGGASSDGGILSDAEAPQPIGIPSPDDRRYLYTEDDRKLIGPLLIGAVIGLLVLLGVGGYLISQAGGADDDLDDDLTVEANGPGTSISATGNESTGQGDGGGRGTLEPNSQADADVTVPSVVGKSRAAAVSELRALGFEVIVVEEESTATAGNVIRQTPSADQEQADGSSVTIYVAAIASADTVQVPLLTGKTQAEAAAELGAAELAVSAAVTREFHPTVAKDTVIKSTPSAGTSVESGSMVILVISDGPEPPRCSDMIDLTESLATSRLEAGGLTVSATPSASDTVTAGNVISCTQTETTAALIISTGVDVCASVIGSELASATATLQAAGLTVTETGGASNQAEVGQVFACSVSGSTAAVSFVLPDDCAAAAGRTVAQARATLEGQGFSNIELDSRASDTVPAGEVISCSISGSTATLVASTGPQDVVVPDVSGQRRVAGTAALVDVGLAVGDVQQVDSDQPRGEIVGTRPAAGAAVAPGTEITLLISNGDTPTVTVPSVIGSTQAAAETAITDLGLVVAIATQQLAIGSPNIGLVVSVDPGQGQDVDVGSTVTLTVGVAPPDDED